MDNKSCLPIIKQNTSEVLATLEQHKKDYRYFEVWLDDLPDADDVFIRSLIKQYPDRIILVFRRPQLAPMQLPLARRLEVIRLCHGQPVLIDLDIGSQQPELAAIAKENLTIKAIVSYHNYELTPSQAELHKLVRRMQVRRPHILKIAAFCRNPEDCLRLLGLSLRLRSGGQRCIILGMGEYGMATRIFGTLWANEMIFAPVSREGQSAPGQLTRQELDTINTILEKDGHGRQ